jgi:transcription elongation GreA/GreB family factor
MSPSILHSHKSLILEQLIESLEKDLEVFVNSAQSSHEAATHAESRADNKYDTRGLEASYLAGAQAQRAQEIRKQLGLCKNLATQSFAPEQTISITALVEIESEDKRQWVFLVPFAGGRSVEVANCKVNIVSSASPLGTELMGRLCGDDFKLEMKGRQIHYEILRVA